MKKFGIIGAVFLLLIVAVLISLAPAIKRLASVNNLFAEDKIVHNFSHMDAVLFSQTLPTRGDAHIWPEDFVPLPETVTIRGERRNLSEFLGETQTTSLLAISNGTIKFENYYLGTTKDDKRISWSMAKSYLSALFGIAVEQGLIESLDDPVTQYVPALKDSAYNNVPIRNVLNMASGVRFNEDYLDKDSDINRMGRVLALGKSMDAFTISIKEQARDPGLTRQYVSIDTHVLAMVLRSVTNKSLHDLFLENLWWKLGPGDDAFYLTDGEGVAFALGGLNMRTRDYALFGQLFLQNGQWNGETLVPEAWVRASTRDSAPSDEMTDNSDFGYGYQWWVPRDSQAHGGDYFAVGIYEQYIYINPEQNVVIVKNSANRDFKSPGQSGASYKTESIDMFRTLARHYGTVKSD